MRRHDCTPHLLLAMEAMQALVSPCVRAGINLSYAKAYDDWERLVEAIYRSFMIDHVIAECEWCQFDRFCLPGVTYDDVHTRHNVIVFANDKEFAIFDFLVDDAQIINILGVPRSGFRDFYHGVYEVDPQPERRIPSDEVRRAWLVEDLGSL